MQQIHIKKNLCSCTCKVTQDSQSYGGEGTLIYSSFLFLSEGTCPIILCIANTVTN